MPVVDELADEYGDRVAFVAPAWKGTFEDTAQRASELMPSGEIAWGLDEDEAIFAAYGIPYQPATVLVSAEGNQVGGWVGGRSKDEMRQAIEGLLAEA